MLGPILAFCAALTFALNNVSARRGVLSGTAAQATIVTLPLGALITFAVVCIFGLLPQLNVFDFRGYVLLSLAGILHFAIGRYCNYRAVKAIGSVLSGPVQEMSIIWTVALAMLLLGETVTVQQTIGILLIMFAPTISMRRKRPTGKKEGVRDFEPKYKEGYIFAGLSALSYGSSPLLVAAAMPEMADLSAGIVSCMISYVAAALTVIVVILPFRGQFEHIRSIEREPLKWFCISGALVSFSQLTRYMALAIAPVSVVTPIQRLSVLLRIILAKIINPTLEIFDKGIYMATALSFIGVLLLTVDTGLAGDALNLPQAVIDFLAFDPVKAQ